MNTKYYQAKYDVQGQAGVSEKHSTKSRPFMLKRIIYAMFLFSFLMIISFYFDLFQNYDFVSLLLGFFVCMIAQFKFLQYFFSYEMESMKIDQIGALRSKIKYLFGQLNPQYLNHKNKKKYYHHTLSKQDVLFSKPNQEIYSNTMQFLVSKTKNNHSQNIQKINRKWRIIISKLEIMKKFIASLLQIHNSRAKIYNNNLGKLTRITQSQFRTWRFLFQSVQKSDILYGKTVNSVPITENSVSEDYQSFNDTFIIDTKTIEKQKQQKNMSNLNQISKSPNFFQITWYQVIRAFQQKQKINNQKLKDIKRVVFQQFKRFYDHMVIRQNKQLAELNNNKNECESKSNERNQISDLLKSHRNKMDELLKVIVNKNRTTQNHQEILKVELQMRMLKVQCQNLQVKISQCDDKIKQLEWQLYTKCLQENKYLQGEALRLFNNKIQNYQNLIMEFQKNYSIFLAERVSRLNQSTLQSPLNKYQQQQQTKLLIRLQFSPNKTSLDLIQSFKSRQKIQQTIKNFFQNLRVTYNELQQNFRQTVQIIQKTQKQLFDKFNDQNSNAQKQRRRGYGGMEEKKLNQPVSTITATYAANLFYDRNFLDILGSLARKDQKIMVRCKTIISQQYQMLISQQNRKLVLNQQINRICIKYKQKEDQKKKIQKYKNTTNNGDSNYQPYMNIVSEIQQIRLNLAVKLSNYQKYLIPSTLKTLLSQIVQRHLKIQQFVSIHEKKPQDETQNQINEQELEQQKNSKFKQYQQYVLKVGTHNFDDPIYETFVRAASFNRGQTKRPVNQEQRSFLTNSSQQKNLESKQQSLKILNKLISVFFQQWSNSQFFHELIKQQLQISLNFKRPALVQPLILQYLKIQQKTKDSGFQDIIPHQTQVFRCLFDVKLNFKGKIAVHIKSKLNFWNRYPLNIKLLIKQFRCPLRICFTPYSIGKSYVSLLERPHLQVQYDVMLSDWHINKIPLFTQFIKIFIVTKLRKKMLWPKRITLSIPLAFKNTLAIAIRQRTQFQNSKFKRNK